MKQVVFTWTLMAPCLAAESFCFLPENTRAHLCTIMVYDATGVFGLTLSPHFSFLIDVASKLA